MDLDNGIWAKGRFVELTREERVNKDTGVKENVDYVIISTGGRRGMFAVRFDGSQISREAFMLLSDADIGDDLLLKVRLSAFNNSIYYALEDVAVYEGA